MGTNAIFVDRERETSLKKPSV